MPDVARDVELEELVAVSVVVEVELEGLDADGLVAVGVGLDAGADDAEDGAVEEFPL